MCCALIRRAYSMPLHLVACTGNVERLDICLVFVRSSSKTAWMQGNAAALSVEVVCRVAKPHRYTHTVPLYIHVPCAIRVLYSVHYGLVSSCVTRLFWGPTVTRYSGGAARSSRRQDGASNAHCKSDRDPAPRTFTRGILTPRFLLFSSLLWRNIPGISSLKYLSLDAFKWSPHEPCTNVTAVK